MQLHTCRHSLPHNAASSKAHVLPCLSQLNMSQCQHSQADAMLAARRQGFNQVGLKIPIRPPRAASGRTYHCEFK